MNRFRAAVIGVLATFHLTARASQVSPTEKAEFLTLVTKLPHKGEFLTDQGVDKGARYIRVLFALTPSDVDVEHLYPVLDLSRGLCERPEYQKYGVEHFAEIAHPTARAFWAAMLFDERAASPEIVDYLRGMLRSDQGSKLLAEMIGPEFDAFKRRVGDAK